MSSDKAYEAYSKVDEAVKKPVYGSDGAAAWQSFRLTQKQTPSTAPVVPMKKTDRKSSGFSSIHEERAHEQKVRSAAGNAAMGSGYTLFKRKKDDYHNNNNNSTEEVTIVEESNDDRTNNTSLDEKNKTSPSVVVADDVEYFIPSKTFTGSKDGYIFTTVDGHTGYYLDAAHSEETKKNPEKKKKKQKRKQRDDVINVEQSSSSNLPPNPFQQVADAIARRNAALKQPKTLGIETINREQGSSISQDDLAALTNMGWAVATDTTTGRVYYYHIKTRTTRWDSPLP